MLIKICKMESWLIVGIVIVAAVLFLVYEANKEPSFNPPPPKKRIEKDMTFEELKQYNGETIK